MIPIKNIYYMLAYAFNSLKHKDYENLQCEDFENIYDLLGSVLIRGLSSQIKRGLHREYIDQQDIIVGIKGKIQMCESIKTQCIIKRQIVCSFDEFGHNTLMNKIIKTTLFYLIRCDRLSGELKKGMKRLILFFSEIDTVALDNVVWDSFLFNRNNLSYKIILDVCYLVYKGLIVNESEGDFKFSTFIEDRLMARLYEKFVLNFYKIECSNEVNTKAEVIDWNITDGEYLSLLPKMKTDISLYSNKSDKLLIIDTKFYPNALQKNFDHSTFISGNMYQIFSYVKNSKFNGTKGGMLLYPTVNYPLNECSEIDGNKIYVRTLNLNVDFEEIKCQLYSILNLLK